MEIEFFVFLKDASQFSTFHENKSKHDTLRERWPNKEVCLVRIFLHSDSLRRFTPQISVFSPNTGKYGPEKTPYLETFHAVTNAILRKV